MTPTSPSRPRAALFVATTLAYLATAPGGAFWLDSGELAAAGATLGVPHAPGHPLYVIVAHAASLLPLGPLAFRVAVLSALCAGASVALVFDLARRAVRVTEPKVSPGVASGVAALVALAFGATTALWLQANRAEVYTLHLLTALLATRLAWDVHSGAAPRPWATMAAVALLVGLGGANHHLLMVFHLPALAALLLAERARVHAVVRALPALVGFAALGLALYVLLPLRAATDPLLNYASPDTLGRFVDVVTARVFQPSVTGASTPLTHNAILAADMALVDLGPVLLLAALAGLAQMAARAPALALALGLALVGNLLTKLLMDVDPTNPDDGGYFQMAWAMLAVLAARPLAALLARRGLPRVAGLATAGLALLIAGVSLAERLPRLALAQVRSPATVESLLLRDVLPGAVVMPSFYALHFGRLYHAAVEGVRPDLLVVHQSFEGHVGGGRPLAEALARRGEPFAEVSWAFVASQRFPTTGLLEVAARRPVYLEPTLNPPVPVDRLRWAGGLWRVGRSAAAAQRAAQARDAARWGAALGEEGRTLREARSTATLLWLEIATTRLSQEDGPAARLALDAARAFTPGSPLAARLQPVAEGLEAGDPAAREAVRRADWSALFGGSDAAAQ